MREIAMPEFMPVRSAPSKAQTVFQIGCCSAHDLKEALERIANEKPDEHGCTWQPIGLIWKTDYYEIVSQKTIFVPLTEEEIAERRKAEEKARAEYAAQLEKEGIDPASLYTVPGGSPQRPSPSRMEVDMYKGIFAVILGMFPGESFDLEQRFARLADHMEKIAARLWPSGTAPGPSAALMQAIKELKEGNQTAEDFPSHLGEKE